VKNAFREQLLELFNKKGNVLVVEWGSTRHYFKKKPMTVAKDYSRPP